jgi:hypothetical protein
MSRLGKGAAGDAKIVMGASAASFRRVRIDPNSKPAITPRELK